MKNLSRPFDDRIEKKEYASIELGDNCHTLSLVVTHT